MSKRFTPTHLPFVGKQKDAKKQSFWRVAAAGNYADGAAVGMTMAAAYVAYVTGAADVLPPILPQIVIDMVRPENMNDALHGQLVGFFSALETALSEARRK